jgi:hypothetical protein
MHTIETIDDVNKMEVIMNFCLTCDTSLSGFEHDICNSCAYDMELEGLDVIEEIERLKKEAEE